MNKQELNPFEAVPASAFAEAASIANELTIADPRAIPGQEAGPDFDDSVLDGPLARLGELVHKYFLITDYMEVLEEHRIDLASPEINNQLGTFDALETMALLTMWVRSERFVEGNLNSLACHGALSAGLFHLAELGAPAEFPKSVEEKLQYYVYALADPSSEDGAHRIFYVGKGKGNRVFAHAHEAEGPEEPGVMDAKLDRIRAIQGSGRRVLTYIIRHKIPTEAQAFDIEASVIDAIRLAKLLDDQDTSLDLTNKVTGHGSKTVGLMSASSVVAEYTAEEAPEITEPSILIRISQSWTPTHGAGEEDQQLYEATRKWWVIGPRREQAKYAFAVSRGLVRAVYAIEEDSWHPGVYGKRLKEWREPRKGEKGVRWSFEGRPTAEMQHFVGTDVSRYFTKGAQSPITYLNC